MNAYPLRENGASRRVLEKAGFRLERIIPNKYPKWSPEHSLAHYRTPGRTLNPPAMADAPRTSSEPQPGMGGIAPFQLGQ